MYRSLNPDKTLHTVEALSTRINERFPSSGLSKVCQELCEVAQESRATAARIARPNIPMRVAVIVFIVLTLFLLGYSIFMMDITWTRLDVAGLVQVSEAGFNDIIIIGAAIFFLITFETRIKRMRTLAALHELRTIAHVIDMHQLTKDPSLYTRKNVILNTTAINEKGDMNAFELTRYLDYCSEMLSLTGKIAVLYAQGFNDSVVVAAVNDLESLTTGLSRKIWQKIMILNKFEENASP